MTNPGGEVLVLDSGGYGTVNITQSVTLRVPPGVYGGMSVFSGNDGITINAPGARVNLDGITINGQGGTNGINIVSANMVDMRRMTIENLVVGVNVGTSSNANLVISDSGIAYNSSHAIVLMPTANLFANVSGSQIKGNGGNGIYVGDHVNLGMSGDLIARNAGYGVEATVTNMNISPMGVSVFADLEVNQLLLNGKGALRFSDTASGSTANAPMLKARMFRNHIVGDGLNNTTISVEGFANLRLSANDMTGCTTAVNTEANASTATFGNNAFVCTTAFSGTAATVRSLN
jgi:ribosomal protein S11